MYIDPFNQQSIYDEKFWDSSQCIWHENSLIDFFRSMLIVAGYTPVDDSKKIWQRNEKTIIICLVDDVRSCSTNFQTDFPYLYDKNTTVITDNQIACPTQFQVLTLPKSFFGIYANPGLNIDWEPDRDFTLAVNRLDSKRLEILLEIVKRTGLESGHVNFNCFQHDNSDPSQALVNQWNSLPKNTINQYQQEYDQICDLMPFRNYDFEHELSYYKSHLNIVIESYSSDHVIALSEKIFRALTTPVPWTLFSGRYSVAFLESMGFDVLGDLVDHNYYDQRMENQNKIEEFVWRGNNAIHKIKRMNFQQVQQRCQRATDHNICLLNRMRSKFSDELLTWMNNFQQVLK